MKAHVRHWVGGKVPDRFNDPDIEYEIYPQTLVDLFEIGYDVMLGHCSIHVPATGHKKDGTYRKAHTVDASPCLWLDDTGRHFRQR